MSTPHVNTKQDIDIERVGDRVILDNDVVRIIVDFEREPDKLVKVDLETADGRWLTGGSVEPMNGAGWYVVNHPTGASRPFSLCDTVSGGVESLITTTCGLTDNGSLPDVDDALALFIDYIYEHFPDPDSDEDDA